MSYDGLLEVLLPSAAPTTSGLVFGTIDAAGKVFLEPGNVPIVPPPPSLTPLTPSSRFVGMMQGSAGKPQSLLIIGVIGGDGNPPGAILQFAGLTAPEGYLLCQGQAVSRAGYARLYAVIGVIYGAGDGSTTFNLPDYRGRGPMGLSASQSQFATPGQRGGEADHTLSWDEMPKHSHGAGADADGFVAHAARGGGFSAGFKNTPGEMVWYRMPDPAGRGLPHNNLSPYLVTNFIIRT